MNGRNPTTFVRFVGTREAAHSAANDGYRQAQVLIGIGKRVKVTFEEAEDELTILQRGFLHAVVFPQIEEQYVHPDGTRSDRRIWKEYFRARFLGERHVLKRVPRWDKKLGRMVLPKRKTPHAERISTEDLSSKRYSQYIDTVIDTATVEMAVQFVFIAEERDAVRWVAQPRKKAQRQQPQPEEATA